MKRKAVFFDWDGTLSTNGTTALPENIEAIHALREAGHVILLCTGRSKGFVPQVGTDILFDGLVAAAGAYVRLGDRLLHRRYLPPTRIPDLLARFAAVDQPCVLEGEEHMFILNEQPQKRRFPEEWIRLASAEDFAPYAQQIISKLTLHGPIPPAIDSLLTSLFTVIHHETYTEAVPRGCNKALGMRFVLDALGMEPADSWAFGDSFNDVDMLSFAGVGVAMGGAPDGVKAVADIIAPPAEEAGVAQTIYRLLRESS